MLGADSTLTVLVSAAGQTGYHYFNHNQKLLEVGQNSTLGIVTWGLGSLEGLSYRTLVAQMADQLAPNLARTMPEDAAKHWVSIFHPKYAAAIASVSQWTQLVAKPPFDPKAATPNPSARTQDEEKTFEQFKAGLTVGFCLGGYSLPDRIPQAYITIFAPTDIKPPTPIKLVQGQYGFWGAPNMVERLIFGRDAGLMSKLKESGKWVGTDAELVAIVNSHQLHHGPVPMRDAIDFIHTCIFSTIKAIKFSNLPQICGGPIELAVITTDRNFRWVRHKTWDTAVTQGE